MQPSGSSTWNNAVKTPILNFNNWWSICSDNLYRYTRESFHERACVG